VSGVSRPAAKLLRPGGAKLTSMTTPMAEARPARKSLAARFTVWTGPLAVRFSGRRWFPLWGLLEHRGRKSGRLHRTPVAPRRVGDGFVIALPFGVDVDWVRNLAAAGQGTMVWKGHRYPVGSPELVDFIAVAPAFNRVERGVVRVAGLTQFAQLRDVAQVERP
jgi:deazaflavin-dependent oxidoreductase (nitroreductase family)